MTETKAPEQLENVKELTLGADMDQAVLSTLGWVVIDSKDNKLALLVEPVESQVVATAGTPNEIKWPWVSRSAHEAEAFVIPGVINLIDPYNEEAPRITTIYTTNGEGQRKCVVTIHAPKTPYYERRIVGVGNGFAEAICLAVLSLREEDDRKADQAVL